MKRTLRQRLEKVDLKSPPKRRSSENDAAYYRLRAQLGIEFEVDAGGVWRNDDCPVLLWLHRCAEGNGTDQDLIVLDEISKTQYFDVEVTTRDFLLAIPKVLKAV